ncbi:MAG: T9SS type A sorting domain-containing protein [Chitinophagaceae bacterium]
MKKIIGFLFILLPAVTNHSFAQTITKVEYFLDADPGFGNGTNVPVSASADIPNLLVSVDIAIVSKGFHNIYVRAKDNNGYWSLTNRWLFIKDILAAAVNKLEYFIDTDPGFGNANNVIISSSANVADVLIPVDISALNKGFHNIYLRSKDDAGNWSLTNRWLYFKDAVQNNLQGGEYFFDAEPGFGNGTAIPFGALGNDVQNFSFGASVSSLSDGAHYLFIRTKEANGRWSLTNVLPFTKSAPLPVTLTNFTAIANGTKSLLSWQTTTEKNNNRFEIERSADGISFSKIGLVHGAGNSITLLNYLFIDSKPYNGANFYRLKQVDIDGHFNFSPVRKVDFNSSFYFKLLNSVTSGTPVIIQTSENNKLIGIYDEGGRKVQEMTLAGSPHSINTEHLSNGIYIVVMHQNGKVLATDRFTVNK